MLSEDRDRWAPGELDQDVFTLFKSNHRFGLRFSDQLVYQPCLDSRCWLRASLMTNEDQLVPDHLGLRVGTDHLVGPFQLRLVVPTDRIFRR